jgi:type II secretory pathway pseudopilin PulG
MPPARKCRRFLSFSRTAREPLMDIMLNSTKSGFTLLASVMTVIGLCLLAGVVMTPLHEDGQESSRDARRAADLKNVQAALECFKRVTGTYPDTGDNWFGDMSDNGSYGYDAGGYIPGLVPNYLPALPKDPDSQYPTAAAGYMYRSNGTDYKMVLHSTPETFPSGNPFHDSRRQDSSWQISSPGGAAW